MEAQGVESLLLFGGFFIFLHLFRGEFILRGKTFVDLLTSSLEAGRKVLCDGVHGVFIVLSDKRVVEVPGKFQ